MFQALKKSVRSLAICSLAIVSSLSSAYADEATTNAQGKTLNVGCEGAFAPFTYIDDREQKSAEKSSGVQKGSPNRGAVSEAD